MSQDAVSLQLEATGKLNSGFNILLYRHEEVRYGLLLLYKQY